MTKKITGYQERKAAGLCVRTGCEEKPEKNADGSYDVYFAPKPPEGKEGNWLQTIPVKSWSRSCVCTGRWSHGSTKPGGPARLG